MTRDKSRKKEQGTEEKKYRYDMHIHTNHSDGIMSVEQAVERAKQIGLTGIAITDHDTVSGLSAARRACKKHGLVFVPGLEITTPGGDILALNVNSAIQFKGSYKDVINQIHKKNGIAILAHPFAGPVADPITDKPDILKMLDAVEVYNASTHLPGNIMAIEFAKQIDKPSFAASDAHNIDSIGNAYIVSSENSADSLTKAIKKGEVVAVIG